MADKVHCIRKTLRLMPQEAKVLSDKAKANGMNEDRNYFILEVQDEYGKDFCR